MTCSATADQMMMRIGSLGAKPLYVKRVTLLGAKVEDGSIK